MNDSGMGTFGVIIYLAILALIIASQWKVYVKAGQAGWACIVPIYNMLILLRIVGRPWWWLLLMLIPFVNIVVLIMVSLDLAKSFNRGAGFGIGLALLPIVFFPILGFGEDQYAGPAAEMA